MPSYICKLEGKYFMWSTVVDAPTTQPMSLKEFMEFYEDEYGRQGMLDLPERMQRVEQKGTSSIHDRTFADVARDNRAGPNETSVSMLKLRAWARGKAVIGRGPCDCERCR